MITSPMRPIASGMAQAFTITPRLTSITQMLTAYAPIDTFIRSLEKDQIDTEKGYPVIKLQDGSWERIAPAVDCWCYGIEQIAKAADDNIDMSPLRRLANQLDKGMPIHPSAIKAAKDLVDRSRSIYLGCFPWRRRSAAVAAEITLHFEELSARMVKHESMILEAA